jgi:hypothetical protein
VLAPHAAHEDRGNSREPKASSDGEPSGDLT